MKNLLLIFLLANILYFMWSAFTEEGRRPGEAIVAESDLGTPLEIVTAAKPAESRNADPAQQPAQTTALTQNPGRSCVTVGPFRELTEAEGIATQYAGDGMRAAHRTAEIDVFVGHWVQIRDVEDPATVRDMLQKLHANGLAESYYVETENFVSLGLFGDVARAERVELQAKSLDLPAEIIPRYNPEAAYFVDIALPPARGAGAIIDAHGLEQVKLRGEATCPE